MSCLWFGHEDEAQAGDAPSKPREPNHPDHRERVVKHIAKLLTSNNVRDLDKGIRLISRNKTLFKAIQNADAAAGAVGTRGAVSGVTDSRASP